MSQINSNKNSILGTARSAYRLMEHIRKPRNKSMHVWSTYP
jgi:hypothetical protein